MTNRNAYGLSIGTKVYDLAWPWTAISSIFLEFHVISQIWDAAAAKRMN